MRKLIVLLLLLLITTLPLIAEDNFDINLSIGNTQSNNFIESNSYLAEGKILYNLNPNSEFHLMIGTGFSYNTKSNIVNNVNFESFMIDKLYAGFEQEIDDTLTVSSLFSTGIGRYLGGGRIYFASASLNLDLKIKFFRTFYFAPGIEIENTSDFIYFKTKLGLGVKVWYLLYLY